jgi:hypothetical protein
MRKQLASLGVVTLAMVGAAVAASPEASASCPSGATCAYTGINFTGSQGPVYGNNSNDAQYYTWSHAESISNNGTQCADWIYQNTNYGGGNFVLPIHYVVSNLSGTWGWHHLYSNHWCNPA